MGLLVACYLSSTYYPNMDINALTFLLINIIFCLLFFSPYPSSSLPLCTNLRAPITAEIPLAFCPYNGTVCCDLSHDSVLEKRFKAMNISDATCASAVKSILCSTCDKFSAELYKAKPGPPRPVPVLCESTAPSVKLSSLSSQGDINFCSTVWDACEKASIFDSPFAPSLQNKAQLPQNLTVSKLTDFWQSKSDFCKAFGGPITSNENEDSFCFSGIPVELNKTETILPPKGMCLEKVDNGSFLNMVAHPDGSNRAFYSTQDGRIFLATIPDQDSGEVLTLDRSNTFVDLTDQVHLSTTLGMMGLAFHPNFAQNGRFFASFNCDKVTNPACFGRCSCNSDVDCDPSKIGTVTEPPCQYHTIVAEYSANGTASNPSMAETAKPREIRRIFAMGLPYQSTAGGQIHFGPEDGYLYMMLGDGGSNKGDLQNFSQNKKSLLGKILRLDVDNIPSNEEVAKLGLWGNYSIPRDNPFAEDNDSQAEIWALGLRQPWRCSFDAERPSYFLCGDTGQDTYEEIDLITKGGNYGWRVYEGFLPFTGDNNNTTLANLTTPIFPITGYSHSDINKKEGSASISGGYVYRSNTDPCIYGSYLYGDLYGGFFWAAQENPKNSGNFKSASIEFSCARDSPIQCDSVPNSPMPALHYLFSFGQDNKKDVYILTSEGVYRIVRPSRCNYSCAKENATAATKPGSPTPSSYSHFSNPCLGLVLFFSSLLLIVEFIL